jgi:uncharacterized membrane protein
MAATIPAHAVIASFRFKEGASNALAKLKDISKAQGHGVQNAAVLTVSHDGKLRIKETADMSGGKGMMVGGVVGGVIGLFGSAVLWPLGIGAAVGGLASKLRDSGFPNKKLEDIGSRLKPGDSLLIVAVDDAAAEPVSRILKDAGADLIREAIDGKVVEELETAAAEIEAPADMAPAETPAAEEREGPEGGATVAAGGVEMSGVQDCPDGYPIKGNATPRSRIYHVPTSPVYAITVPEMCFATEDDALAAGYRAPRRRPRQKPLDAAQ